MIGTFTQSVSPKHTRTHTRCGGLNPRALVPMVFTLHTHTHTHRTLHSFKLSHMTPKTSFEGKGTEAFADLIVLITKCGAKLCLAAAPLKVIALRLQFSVFTVSFPPGEEFVSLRSHVGVICAAKGFYHSTIQVSRL